MSAKKANINITKYISDSWKIFQKNWQLLLQIGVIMTVIQLLPNIYKIFYGDEQLAIISIVATILGMILSIGWIKILIKLTSGKKAELEDLWGSVDRVIPYFIATFAVGIVVFLGFLLFIIPGFYFAIKYMFVPYLIIDKNLSIGEAFSKSSQMTDGIKWQLVAMWFATFVLNILGLLAFIVGVVITSVVTSLAYAKLYNSLKK